MVLEYLPTFTLKITQSCRSIYQHHGSHLGFSVATSHLSGKALPGTLPCMQTWQGSTALRAQETDFGAGTGALRKAGVKATTT